MVTEEGTGSQWACLLPAIHSRQLSGEGPLRLFSLGHMSEWGRLRIPPRQEWTPGTSKICSRPSFPLALSSFLPPLSLSQTWTGCLGHHSFHAIINQVRSYPPELWLSLRMEQNGAWGAGGLQPQLELPVYIGRGPQWCSMGLPIHSVQALGGEEAPIQGLGSAGRHYQVGIHLPSPSGHCLCTPGTQNEEGAA